MWIPCAHVRYIQFISDREDDLIPCFYFSWQSDLHPSTHAAAVQTHSLLTAPLPLCSSPLSFNLQPPSALGSRGGGGGRGGGWWRWEEEGDQSHPVVCFPLSYFPLLHRFNTLDHVGQWPRASMCVCVCVYAHVFVLIVHTYTSTCMHVCIRRAFGWDQISCVVMWACILLW